MFRKKIYLMNELRNPYSCEKPISGVITLRTGARLTNLTLSLAELPDSACLSFFLALRSGGELSFHKIESSTSEFSVAAFKDELAMDFILIVCDGKNSYAAAYGGDLKESAYETSQVILKRFNERQAKQQPYFRKISQKLNRVLEKYPAYPPLIKAVKNSYWVKVEGEKNFYALGIIIENDSPRYIAYALPEESGAPQASFSYLEIVEKDKTFGFFVLYQDAVTGSIVSGS